MSAECPKPGEQATLADRIGRIERLEVELLRETAELFVKNEVITNSDFFVLGAVRRTISQSKGFRDLITAKNFPCAAAILRMQIDTAMRVNALVLVEEPDTFCQAILDGQRFNTFKDTAGSRMTDAYLRKKLSEKYPIINPVYEQTSDFIHLSGRHFCDAIFVVNDNMPEVKIVISAADPPHPDDLCFEIVDMFFDISEITAILLLGYFIARSGSVCA
jgi:hypothetical protein